MKGRLGKFGTAFLALALALALTGAGFAAWTDTLTIEGNVDTGELDWEFSRGVFTHMDHGLDWNCDPDFTNVRQVDKDVGSTTGQFKDTDADGDDDTLEVTLDNVYPCYYEHIAFWVHNNGTIPLIIEKIIISSDYETHEFYELPCLVDLDLDGDDEPDLNLNWGNNFGVQLHPCVEANMSFDLHVKQDAPQGESLSFTIEIIAVQWNEYSP